MPAPAPPTAASDGAVRRAASPAVVVVTLTLLLGIQPVATDLYLPALPALGRAFGAATGTVQLTLAMLIVAFGVAQLVWGPLADRFGRRPVLFVGLALFTAAGAAAALAGSIEALLACRALQGVGMAAAVTCGRSVVRDLYQPAEGAHVMSQAMGGLGVVSLASPVLGSLAAQAFGWRAAVGLTALFGVGALAWIALRFDETLARRNPRATAPAQVLRNWRDIAVHPTFVAWTLLLCGTYGGLFVMLATSSFVFIEVLGASRLGYGAFLASNALAYIGGTVLCRRLLAVMPPHRAVRFGAALSLAGGALLAGLSLLGVQSMWAVVLPQWLYALGHGIHQPCGQSGAVGPFAERAGTAASLSGFSMMAVAFATSLVLARCMNGTVLPLTLGVGAFGAFVALVGWTLVQRHGKAPAPAPKADAEAAATATEMAV